MFVYTLLYDSNKVDPTFLQQFVVCAFHVAHSVAVFSEDNKPHNNKYLHILDNGNGLHCSDAWTLVK